MKGYNQLTQVEFDLLTEFPVCDEVATDLTQNYQVDGQDIIGVEDPVHKNSFNMYVVDYNVEV